MQIQQEKEYIKRGNKHKQTKKENQNALVTYVTTNKSIISKRSRYNEWQTNDEYEAKIRTHD